ncbi:GH3 auxin-responsive promoter family protein [Salinivirga sp.]|uniref:GH3 auxin-responsive promoter family protein n=1 Tax=Salinivirga sp. TaxID=1970192 RepID=UPI002B482258|nr:GH3 auxin-responsive promoter family protein [Salinivirga sp.]
MPILNSIVSWLNLKRMSQINLMRQYPSDVQYETFLRLINQAAPTEWGKKYHYRDIKGYDHFKERVPLQTYDDIKPWIDRMRQGESELLWPGEIKWFAKSSGTTADKSKFIPVTEESLEECHFRGGKDVMAIYNDNYPENNYLSGKALTLGGSHQINESRESYYGDLSAILIQNMPFWTHFIRTPNKETILIDEFENKIQKIMSATLEENVTSLAGVPSWMLVLIKAILEKTGKQNLLEVWPNLELFIHGGVNFTPYRQMYKELIPSDQMRYMETYNASEGFFAIQDEPSRDDMLLMLDLGVFYEFIPMDQLDEDHPKTVTIEEVEIGKNYAMVISTNSGLWRYMIGDTVIFTSTFPHKLKISGRTKHFINAFGEELIVDNAIKAIDVACKNSNAKVSQFTAAPIYMKNKDSGGHEWIIEFEREPDSMDHFTVSLDNALQTVNSDYEAKRYKDSVLSMPVIHKAPDGLFYKWMKKRGKLGGQNKVPQLANNRKYIDELIQMMP